MKDFLVGFGRIVHGGWRASPLRFAFLYALMLVEFVSWPLAPLVLKHVTDAVVAGNVGDATVAAAFLPLLALLNQVGGHLAQVAWVELQDLNLLRGVGELGELAQGTPGLEHHERPDYADRLELMRNEGNPMYMSVRIATRTLGLAIQLAITIVMLAALQPLLLLLLLFALAPLAAARWAAARWERAWVGAADLSRRATHLLDLAVRADAAKEIRIFGLEDELTRRLNASREELRRVRFRAEYEGVAALAAAQIFFAVGYVSGLLLVVRGAVAGDHTAGDVVLAVTLAAQTNALVHDIVFSSQFVQRSVRAVARLAWLRELVARLYPQRDHPGRVPRRLERGIRFERVAFRYPGTDADVLADVDLDVPAGSTLAFVGENGAGKSTLIKLLCRFYEPTDGRILLDDEDLAELPPDEWRERIAAGFQDFVRFELLARESVGIGDLPAVEVETAVTAAVERAAADDVVERLPAGLATELGKSFSDGHELSGGQWQKLALARAMMRERPLLLVLDEPTSALDAHAEHELFERYAESARTVAKATGGVAIFVSHRFSTVRMADLIVVIEDGRVAERGTHEELLARGGTYAELFALQAAAYSG